MNKLEYETTMKAQRKKHILFAGGETAGPTVPLLAVAKALVSKDESIIPVFVDVKKSVAVSLVEKNKFALRYVISGKLRRYFSWANFLSPIKILIGFIQSLLLISKLKPRLVMGAGGYVQFPLILAAKIFGVPVLIHQQDVIPTLSNKLCAPFANKITTTFESSLKDFPQGSGLNSSYLKSNKIVWTGNPSAMNSDKTSREEGLKLFGLNDKWPVVLVIGGGSGAAGLNEVVAKCAPKLLDIVQILHSTGSGKGTKISHERYKQLPFITEMDLAYAAADIVIARAGIGTITELSALGKTSIIVPMPDSHQEANAELLFLQKAAFVMDQREITPEMLSGSVRKILFDQDLQKLLQSNIAKIMPKDANIKIANLITEELIR